MFQYYFYLYGSKTNYCMVQYRCLTNMLLKYLEKNIASLSQAKNIFEINHSKGKKQ